MAINPPSDIVLGTMLAADPDKYQAATERLQRLAATAAARVEAARAAAGSAGPLSATSEFQRLSSSTGIARPSLSDPGSRTVSKDAFGQLEAFVLQTFIESMLPKNAETVFGKGTAGEVWKSMLAEKLANEMAQSGQVGLAKRLAEGATAARPPHVIGSHGGGAGSAAPLPATSLLSALPYLQQDAGDRADEAQPPGINAAKDRS